VGDFYADKRKCVGYRDEEARWNIPGYRVTIARAKELGWTLIDLPRMGDYRFFMCEPGVLSEALVGEHAADHGLLYVEGGRVRIVKQAPRRELVDKDGEIRYLRFAIINRKRDASVEPYLKHQATPIDMERPVPTCRDGMRLP
jgi:hypothetical protein